MPAVLTHKSIMLLARERLADVRDRLQAKVASGGPVTDLEHRVLYLAGKAYDMMTDNAAGTEPAIQFPTGAGFTTPLGRGVSRFAVMGSMGPDIPGLAGILAPGSAWIFDTVHKGNPDAQREPVVARTTDVALALWQQASTAIDARPEGTPSQTNAKTAARAAMRAYVLGHLCHMAGDILSHPYVNDLEWHVGTSLRSKFSHPRTEGTIDARVAQQVLRRQSTREGQDWAVWWPTVDEVPPEFYTAYDAALEQVYRVRSHRPVGFGAFEKSFGELSPPTSDPAFYKDGYTVFRNGIIAMGYGWGYWTWWAFLMPAMVPLMALFPLALAMPHGGKFLTNTPAQHADERAFFEIAMLPMAMSTLIPLVYGFFAISMTTRGVETMAAAGGTSAIVYLLATFMFFASLGIDDAPWWLRWLIIFGLPAAFGLVFSITALANVGHGKTGRLVLALVFAAPLIVTVLFLALFSLAVWLPQAIAGGSTEAATIVFGIITGLFIVAVGIAWFVLPKVLRDARIPERPEAFPADRPHFVRVFDDTTLFHDPVNAVPTLAQRFFPSDGRELVKLWWDGGGDMYVRSRRLDLEFSFSGKDAPGQVVQVPVSPLTATQFGDYLTRTVKDSGAATGHLKFTVVYPADLDYDLPSGATFSDEGDVAEAEKPDKYSARLETEESQKYHKLGTSADNTDYILHHAPKSLQAIRFGHAGPIPFDPREEGVVDGPGHVHSDGNKVLGDGTFFRTFFLPGDRVQARGQARIVTQVRSDTEMVVSSAFNPGLDNGTDYARVGSETETPQGYSYVMDPSGGAVGGQAIMDYAADFAALLCLGATPHLLKSTDLTVPTLAGKKKPDNTAADPAVAKVYQVFRNWSLDRRRVNEWRTIVHGGAQSEKGAVPATYDSAMPTPKDPGWHPGPDAGEPVLRDLGWVPLLRSWLTVAGNKTKNAADATAPLGGGHSNQELSRALAFLLDMPDPVAVH